MRVSADVHSEFAGYEKTDVLTAILAYEDLGDGRFQAKLEQSPFYAAGGGQVSDTGFIEDEETGARAELVEATRLPDDDQVLTFEGEGFAAGMRVRAVVPWSVRFPTMANHTGDPPAAQGAAGGARRARAPGRLGRAAGQAALRLQPSAAGHGRGAGRARAARERGDLPQPAGAGLHRPDRGGAAARRDDALRREVRRRGAAGRHRGLLARALRRHARALDRRDRAVRDHVRELGRLGHAPHRGGHLGRGLRAAPWTRGGSGRAAGRARAGAEGGAGAGREGRGEGRGPQRGGDRRRERLRRPGRRGGRGRAARGVRPDQAGARAGGGRARRCRGRPRAPRRQLRPLARRSSRRGRRDQGGRGRGGRRRRRAATMARAGGRDPEKLGDALAKAEEALRRALA